MIEIAKYISSIINLQEPTKSYIICGIYTVMIFLSVIVIGAIVNKIETYSMRGLTKLFNQKVASFICNRMTFPGTVVHELAHALFAAMLGAEVTKIRLLSLKSDGRLGWVEYRTRGKLIMRGLQQGWSSCAPTVCGLILENLMFYLIADRYVTSILGKLIIMYMMISVGFHMSMSKSDIVNYIKGSWAFCGILYVLLLIVRLM